MKFVVCLAVMSLVVASVSAQQRYELIVPGSDVASHAERTDATLVVVDQKGVATKYDRAPRFDSEDGQYLGYRSVSSRQIIRWPVSDRGTMLIAADSGVAPNFRRSQMEIRAIAPPAQQIAGAGIEADSSYRIVPYVPKNRRKAMTLDAGGIPVLGDIVDSESQFWYFTPLGNNYFRVHSGTLGRHWSLAGGANGELAMVETNESPEQLWHFAPVARAPGYYVLANATAAVNPPSITVLPGGGLGLAKCSWSDPQLWEFVRVAAPLPAVFGEYRFRSREIRPNEDLAAAQIDFVNSHTKELWVAIADRQAPSASIQLKIPPGETKTVTLERDPGGTLVEVYERILPNGLVERDEFVTDLPPATRYDASVYELIVQSVAIDRTVKGGKVEDVQHAPRSIGWFELAPGPSLEGGAIDVYAVAKSQQNSGQVRRIDPQQWNPAPQPADPVESLLKKYEKKG